MTDTATPVRDRLIDVLTTLRDLDVEVNSLVVDRANGVRGISLWLTTRTDFIRVVDELGLKAQERAPQRSDHRLFFAHQGKEVFETPLLIQCLSCEHHDDWVSRADEAAREEASA